MIHIYGLETYVLEALCTQHTPSLEDFIATLEQQLEDGELTIDEVSQLIYDYNNGC